MEGGVGWVVRNQHAGGCQRQGQGNSINLLGSSRQMSSDTEIVL